MSSADLQLRQDFLKIRIPPPPSSSSVVNAPLTLQSCTEKNGAIIREEEERDVVVEEEEECRTPTSREHKIPAVLSCPPAPRKPKRAAPCKRKLSEFDFFEIVNREEVESFFQSSFDLLPKRRCPCK